MKSSVSTETAKAKELNKDEHGCVKDVQVLKEPWWTSNRVTLQAMNDRVP